MSLSFRPLLVLLLCIPVVAGVLHYFLMARELRLKGGRVSVQFFELPDLFLTASLALYFALQGVQILIKPEPQTGLRAEHVWSNAGFMAVVLLVVLLFVRLRRLPVVKAFSLEFNAMPACFLRAAFSLLAALPAIWAAGVGWDLLMPGQGPEQALVSLFRNSVETGDSRSVWLVVASALLGAPFFEEMLFRGYFYVTLKRYLGSVRAAFLVSILFAVCHGYAGVIPGLMILSICQILVFEKYGSLWICIGMHACFNSLGLVQLYMEARGWMPH